MLTGQRPFAGEEISDTLAAVLKTEPDWRRLPAATPDSVLRLLRRCLEKDPRRRLQAIGEARVQIEDLLSGVPEPTEARVPRLAALAARAAVGYRRRARSRTAAGDVGAMAFGEAGGSSACAP